jgi:hypothetical protein
VGMPLLLAQATLGQGPVQMIQPSAASTAGFLVVVAVVALAFLLCVDHAYRDAPNRWAQFMRAALAYAAVLVVSYALAASGTFAQFVGRPQSLGYFAASNLLVLALALSPFGRRLALATPYAALVGVQAFRLPLELVLHSWWQQGVVPIQMTYTGDNWDILSGGLALICGVGLRRTPIALQPWVAGGFSLVGVGLLLNVMGIAVRSLPGPFRTYTSAPSVLLPFHAPYTWIVPGCVGAALFFHVVLVRKLLLAHQQTAA